MKIETSPTKTKIFEIALRLFVKEGITETTTRDLAREAGIAEGTIYRHFVSKDELITELFVTNYTAYARRLNDIQKQHRSFEGKLSAMIIDICRLFDTNPTLFRFLLLVQHQSLNRVVDNENNPVTIVQTIVADAISRKELGPFDPAFATATLFGIILQTATFTLYGRLLGPMSHYASSIIAACTHALQITQEQAIPKEGNDHE